MKLPGNMQAMMKQAQQMQEKMAQEVAQIKVEASAGGGMVTVKMDGNKNLLSVKIDPEVAGDGAMVQNIVGAGGRATPQKNRKKSQRTNKGVIGGPGPA